VLLRYKHPVTIVTKGSLILRDLDLLTELAQQRLVAVMISLTTLDDELKRILEPRAAAPKARLRAIRVMREAGIPVGVLCSPMIPMINDSEIENLLNEAHAAGAQSAAYMMLRLPLEVAPLFEEWLAGALSATGRACAEPDPPEPWRRALRQPFWCTHARRRGVRRSARAAFCQGDQTSWLNHREGYNLDCTAFCPPGRQMSLI
jgi:DNA repair photolyase